MEASSHPNFAHDASGGRVGGWLTVQLNVPEHHHLLQVDLHPIRPISAATASAPVDSHLGEDASNFNAVYQSHNTSLQPRLMML
jgi:hypothetical protein